MTRRFTVRVGDVEASALLHDDAHEFADQFWNALPIAGTCRQVHWSGECGYLKDEKLVNTEPIRHRPISMYSAGVIAMRPAWGEIALAYGESQARDEHRIGAVAVHLATVDTGLAEYLQVLAAMPYTGEVAYSMSKES
ncbi:hypothetical protein ACSMXN_07075 [Jatrophihabitans sp. DSM 45814]